MPHGTNAQEDTILTFTLDELEKATENFNQSLNTGEIGFGSVHKGLIASLAYPYDDIDVVVKRVKSGQMGKTQLDAEVRLFGNIKHQNLLKLIGYCNEVIENERTWFLVYEYMHMGSLDRHLSSLPWRMRLKIAKDAATGLAYLHEGMIIFKDFKPSNILLDKNMNAKLSYFGYVKEGRTDGQTQVTASVAGTKGYSAPESVQNSSLTTKMDVWSYGIFLQELITGRLPVAHENQENNPECMRWVCCYTGAGMSKLIVDPGLKGKYSEKSMQKVASIANKCLVLEPELRPKMSKVLKVVKKALESEMSS